MCGISVLINKDNQSLEQDLIQKMTDTIHHRGPDGEGFFHGDNFAFGHRRLAIIDLDERSNQPMKGLDGLVITYNGEVYNYIELRDELKEQGYDFSTESDTEVILAAYHCWGKECLHRFNGMWAFAIYDPRTNQIFAARDRFGIKPLYYSVVGSYLAFASEIKQFTSLPNWSAKANHNLLFDFIVGGKLDQSEFTMFDGVKQVPGGCCLEYKLESHTYCIQRWYDLSKSYEKNTLYSDKKAGDKFLELLTDSVNLRLRSDVKVGSCLSGGMDSSSIVVIMHELLSKSLSSFSQHTVSSCFENKKYDEQEYIDAVNEKTKATPHKVFPSDKALFDSIENIIWYQDEPFGSTSIFAQWTVFEEARAQGLKVMLDGQGADEQLAGYQSFFVPLLKDAITKFNPFLALKICKALSHHHNVNSKKLLINALYHCCPMRIKKIVTNLKHKRLHSWLNKNAFKLDPNPMKNLRKFSVLQLIKTSLPSLLHYEDRSSMAKSIEARVPFLDYRLVEFVLSLENNQKIKEGITKHVLREGLKDLLPEKVLTRVDKLGFVTEEEKWMRANSETVLSVLDNEWPDYIDGKKLLAYVKDLLESDKSFDFLIWRLFCVQMWRQRFDVCFSN